jgi:hypothetical protein
MSLAIVATAAALVAVCAPSSLRIRTHLPMAKQMRQNFATSCGLMLALLSSTANAADILIAEMEDFRGEKTIDYVRRELRRFSF